MGADHEREVGLILEAYGHWHTGELDRFFAMVDDAVEWEPPAYAPDPAKRVGRDQMESGVMAYFDEFSAFVPSARHIYPAQGESRYLVLASTFTRGKQSGIETMMEVGHLVEVRDDKLMRLEVHPDRGDAFLAAGLDADAPPPDLKPA